MKIRLENYNNEWPKKFRDLKKELVDIIGFADPQIEHIGSTSIAGLAAKPIIDILVGVDNKTTLDKTIEPLVKHRFIFYEIYNKMMPYRRFFVKHNSENLDIPNPIKFETEIPNSTQEHNLRSAHVHILEYNSTHWIRHIAFRDYLRAFSDVRNDYQILKENLSHKEWFDGNDYNLAKDSFIKRTEKKATEWYNSTTNKLKRDDLN